MAHAATGWGLPGAPKVVVSVSQERPSASSTVTWTPSATETPAPDGGTAVAEA